MTYALALPLQEALFQHLSTDPDLTAALNGAVYDALPARHAAADLCDHRPGGGARPF
ncbi:hypothetical protein [Phaeobacter sp. BS23]|uniref:hypothetical protein n=1 Tax=Phaeobacter sp. BS23 TaxID=2907239 RepID=UPI00386A01EC